MSEQPVRVEFVTGQAGTGKTYLMKERLSRPRAKGERHYGTLCATTGIAAVNLGEGVTTINSALGYYDEDSLRENYEEGKLQKRIMKLFEVGANLAVDEISMFSAKSLDYLYLAFKEINQLSTVIARGGYGLVLTGDFCQLPPVKGDYAFKANCWGEFAGNTTRLEKIWRQDNLEFLRAINAARCGDGHVCASVLQDLSQGLIERGEAGIFTNHIDSNSASTIITAINSDVDRINNARYLDLLQQGHKKITFKSYRWGKQLGEWKQIPEELNVTENAYVMILANNPPDFDYANGDCGHVLTASEGKDGAVGGICFINLKRNDNEVKVGKVMRRVMVKDKPSEGNLPDPLEYKSFTEFKSTYVKTPTSPFPEMAYKMYCVEFTAANKTLPNQPYYDYEERKWVIGEIVYMPLRLAYASTVHKTQGLTLDAVQISPSHRFFGEGSMMYVALSRVRSHEGLKVVGSPKLLEERTNIKEEVLRWV